MERKIEKKERKKERQCVSKEAIEVSSTLVTLEGKNCNLETKNNLETAKFRGLEYFHNPNTK